MSRIKNTVKNIFFGYISSIIALALSFVSRTVFIHILGTTYLGVNGLFTNILSVLSFAELGFGTAMNFSLYKPVAGKNTEEIKSLMQFYKTAYRVIALVITVAGFAILPFLHFIVKDTGGIEHIPLFYLIFLFNTVSSYFVSYKFSLLYAEQKNYIFTNINTVTNFITVLVQIAVLVFFQNFLVYLLTAAAVGLLQKIYINSYLNKMYPYLTEKNVAPISQETLAPIKKNVGALIWHKLGEISVYQTDNIIISAFINVTTVGLISNYNLIITSVSGFIHIIFNSGVSSFGNLIATEMEERQYEIFRVYRFIAFWLFGFSSIAFIMLLTPFITLWIGESMTVSPMVVALIIVNYYMVGHRTCVNNVKSAGGVFRQDRFVSLLQAVVNLVVSVILVRSIGLPGVYIGTVAQGLIASVVKPIIVYRHLFRVRARDYFIDGLKYALAVVLAGGLCYLLGQAVMPSVTVTGFILLTLLVAVVPNGLFLVLYGRSSEFLYMKNIILSKLKRG